jgi:uncharacterized protein
MQRNQPTKLSAAEAKALGAFLSHKDRPEGTLSLHELQGFLFAVACAPELIMPSEWLPMIGDDREMRYEDLDEAQGILDLITGLYNEINAAVIERSDAMPRGCKFLEGSGANFDEEAPVSQWSRGFALGHDWLSELWDECVPDEHSAMSEELGACIMTLSFFSSKEMAEALYREAAPQKGGMKPKAFQRFEATMRRLFPSALASYANIGRTVSEVLASKGAADD